MERDNPNESRIHLAVSLAYEVFMTLLVVLFAWFWATLPWAMGAAVLGEPIIYHADGSLAEVRAGILLCLVLIAGTITTYVWLRSNTTEH